MNDTSKLIAVFVVGILIGVGGFYLLGTSSWFNNLHYIHSRINNCLSTLSGVGNTVS